MTVFFSPNYRPNLTVKWTQVPLLLISLKMALLCCWRLPWWLRQESVCLQCGRPGFDPWVGKIFWRRKWQPTPVLLPGKSHGQRSLVGYSPWSRKESDMTSDFTFTFHFHALEKEMATHSSVLAWRIPWTEEPGRLQSIGSQRVRHDSSNLTHTSLPLR